MKGKDYKSRKGNQKIVAIFILIIMLGFMRWIVLNNMDFYLSKPGLFGLIVNGQWSAAYTIFFVLVSLIGAAVIYYFNQNRKKA